MAMYLLARTWYHTLIDDRWGKAGKVTIQENKAVCLAGINVERIAAGRIIEHWSQFDLAGLVRQLQA